MKPSTALHANHAAIRSVVARHRACNARVFSSVLHGDDQEGSDMDILIDPIQETTMFDIGAIVTPNHVPSDRNRPETRDRHQSRVRGRAYADCGHVTFWEISPGRREVEVDVQGTYAYSVHIKLPW